MAFRKKYTIPSISEDDNDIYHVYEHLRDITVATICDKDPAQNCFLASCLDRECCKCGVKLLKFTDLEMSLSEDAPMSHGKDMNTFQSDLRINLRLLENVQNRE